MADTNFRGPIGAMGALEVEAGTTASVQPLDGLSYFYQGATMLDPRGGPFAKDGTAPGRVPAFLLYPEVLTVDVIPQATNTGVIANAQVVTAATPMALQTVAVGITATNAAQIAVGVPFIPQGTSVVTTVALTIDFGFTLGTCTAAATTVAVPNNTWFQPGMWICIGNVANAAGTASLLTQVTGVSSTNLTTITVSPAPLTTLVAPIGAANLLGAGLLPPAAAFGPVTATPNAVAKNYAAGLVRAHNPREMSARALSLAASSQVLGTATFTVAGWDVWGQPMTELLTATGTTPAYGKKAWKYIASITPQQSQAGTYVVGLSDVFGLPFRCDEYQQLKVYAGNTAVVNNVGITTAVLTAQNSTTGDVRGTVQVSAFGGGTAITSAATTNGTGRVYITQAPTLEAIITSNPNFVTPLFGNAQSTT